MRPALNSAVGMPVARAREGSARLVPHAPVRDDWLGRPRASGAEDRRHDALTALRADGG